MEQFGEGNTINWDEETGLKEEMEQKYGEGPFCIVKIIAVPKERIRDVGHNQWIVIGKHIGEEFFLYNAHPTIRQWTCNKKDIGETTFSGIHFKKQ